MRITDINIDRFGVWRDLQLPLNEQGVTVFYGPNEAGKSTLMRFVRGTLYGFNPRGERVTRNGLSTEGKGSLRIIHDAGEHTVYREADAGQRGRVRVDDLDWGTISEDRVKTLLSRTSESLFENIFAIGLAELQELATLDGEEVAEHIYGLSLGPEGERILRARAACEREQALLVSEDHKAGELVTLAQRMADIDRQLAEVGDVSHKHQHLRGERERLNAEIEQAERRRQLLQDNVRGYRFLERVHAPWARERKLRQERAALPQLGLLPDDGLTRYDRFAREIETHKKKRSAVLEEAKRLYQQAGEQTGDTTLRQHECTIRRLAEERPDIQLRERRLAEKQSRADKLKRQLEAHTPGSQGPWTGDRLVGGGAFGTSLTRLTAAARDYHQALSRKSRAVKRYKGLVASSQKRQNAFTERTKSLGGLSLVNAIKATRRRLAEVEDLNRLRLEEARLTGQVQAPRRPRTLAAAPRTTLNFRDLPPLFYLVMWFFTGAGLTLFFCGLWWATEYENLLGHTAWIVGAIYSCFGLCMAGVTWTVRQHFEQFFEGGLAEGTRYSLTGAADVEPDTHPEAERELARVRQSIADLVQRSTLPGLKQAAAEGGDLVGADVLIRTSQRLADLEELRREEERIAGDRKRLSSYRDILRQRQRDVGLRRREWCDVLREAGLEETLKVDKAIEQWQAVHAASDVHREYAVLQELIDRDRKAIDAHRHDVERLRGLLPAQNTVSRPTDPDRLLAHWLEELRHTDGASAEQLGLRRQARAKRKEASRLETSIRDLSSQQKMLLMQAGVSTRDEFEGRMQLAVRQRELTRLLEEAQLEVQMVAEEEPELALVEDDLLGFKANDNKRRITDSEIELKQIDRDIQSAREELGRVKRELTELANDRRAVSLRFEREQLANELRQATERWCALDLAADSIDRIRHRLERHAQSDTLQLASKYLTQLTLGRYHNIWAPLGEQQLRIDDDTDQTLTAGQLSTGTREQLFLAIRLAMIRQFAQQGTELPMVLDDVFVNFDQTRTEAAVDTILDVAQSGQQVLLFTCHLHLADIFEEKGIDALWLPSNGTSVIERKAG